MTAKTVDEVIKELVNQVIGEVVGHYEDTNGDIDELSNEAKYALLTIVLGCLGEDEEARYHSLRGCERCLGRYSVRSTIKGKVEEVFDGRK